EGGGGVGGGGPGGGRLAAGRSRLALLAADASAMPDPVTVLPRAYVAGRVKWLPAQRARRPPLLDYLDGPARERPCRLRADSHPEHGRSVLRDVIGERLKWLLALLLG